jgi:hypothetical protein
MDNKKSRRKDGKDGTLALLECLEGQQRCPQELPGIHN